MAQTHTCQGNDWNGAHGMGKQSEWVSEWATLRHTLRAVVFIMMPFIFFILRNLCDAHKSVFCRKNYNYIYRTLTHIFLGTHINTFLQLCVWRLLFSCLFLSSVFFLFITPTVVSQPLSTHHSVSRHFIRTLFSLFFSLLCLTSPSFFWLLSIFVSDPFGAHLSTVSQCCTDLIFFPRTDWLCNSLVAIPFQKPLLLFFPLNMLKKMFAVT